MMNVLSNAVKYNRENGQIYISCMEIPSEQPEMMTMEAITQGTAEHIMHHVMINFILNGEMRFMQFDFTRESADTKNVFLFVEDYTVPQQQMMLLLEKKLVL